MELLRMLASDLPLADKDPIVLVCLAAALISLLMGLKARRIAQEFSPEALEKISVRLLKLDDQVAEIQQILRNIPGAIPEEEETQTPLEALTQGTQKKKPPTA